MNHMQQQLLALWLHLHQSNLEFYMAICIIASTVSANSFRTHLLIPDEKLKYDMRFRTYGQIDRNFRLFVDDDTACINNLRMDRNCFYRLCEKLNRDAGLQDGKHVCLKEQVAIFLSVLAHNKKSRIVNFDFVRSSQTISKYFHRVLHAVLRLHADLLVKPRPVTPDNAPERWQYFQGCLGALDGTHIRVKVPKDRQIPYRGRKGIITINVLAACDWDMNFTYVLAGWEGSSADSRILRNALARPDGLRVPAGQYYLCDNGYTHGEGFVTPYTRTRYHLQQWGHGTEAPQNAHEYFNMVHSKARNVIERAFGVLKKRWVAIDEQAKYPVEVQNRVILACCLLHNFIRQNMAQDPLEAADLPADPDLGIEDEVPIGYVQVLRPSPQWDNFRENLANNLYNEWLDMRGDVN